MKILQSFILVSLQAQLMMKNLVLKKLIMLMSGVMPWMKKWRLSLKMCNNRKKIHTYILIIIIIMAVVLSVELLLLKAS